VPEDDCKYLGLHGMTSEQRIAKPLYGLVKSYVTAAWTEMTAQTGKLMVLFSPSPLSFYRVQEYADVEKAKEWCERFAAVPSKQNYVRLIVCDAINWQDFAPGTLFDSGHKKRHKYMVLWKLLEPCYYKMCEFEQLHDAIHYASATC
jgi:hypothetical protein